MTTYIQAKSDAVDARVRWERAIATFDPHQDTEACQAQAEAAWECLRDWDCCAAKLEEMETAANFER
jgi:hypothetical protein